MQLIEAKKIIEKLNLDGKIILSRSIRNIQSIFPEYATQCGMNILKIMVDNSIKKLNAKNIICN